MHDYSIFYCYKKLYVKESISFEVSCFITLTYQPPLIITLSNVISYNCVVNIFDAWQCIEASGYC